jgi:hypothetical protein
MELEIDFLGSKYTLVSHENDAQYYPLLWIEAAIGDGVGSLNKRFVGPGYTITRRNQLALSVGSPMLCRRSFPQGCVS